MEKDANFLYLGAYEKMLKHVSKSLEICNQINSANILGLANAIKPYQAFVNANSNFLGLAESLQKSISIYEKANMSYLSSGLMADSMISFFQVLVQALERYSKIAVPKSIKAMASALETVSRTIIPEQFVKLQQIDYSSIFANIIPNASTFSDVLETAYAIVEDELEEDIDDIDSFTEEEIQEALQEQVEAPAKFQERVANWTEKKIVQYFIIWQIFNFIWNNFAQPYFQEKVGMPVTAYVVSNVKELPQKGAKIIGQIHENIEAIIIENTNYYYKVTFTDENGKTKEGYVAKRNLKLIEEETEAVSE